MLLEDFEKAQSGGLVDPASPGSVADLKAFVNSPVSKKTVLPQPVSNQNSNPISTSASQDNEMLPSWINNTLSDVSQAVNHPIDLIAGTMRSGLEQAAGGFNQMTAEQGLQAIDYANKTRPGYQAPESFAGIPADDPTQVKQKIADSVTQLKAAAQSGKDLYDSGKALAAGLEEAFPQQSYLGTMARGVTTSIGYQLPVMAATFIMPELAVPLTAEMYFTTAGQKYGERRNDQGFDVPTSVADAKYQGGVEVATELSGSYFMGQFWKAAKKGLPALKPFVEELISEYAGEAVATALQNGNDATRENPGSSLADYILSKQHLSDQLDTLVSTVMQSGAMGIPGSVVQFDSKRRVQNYVSQLQDSIQQMEANGETQFTTPDGSVVGIHEVRSELQRLQKDFGLDVKSQEQEAVQAVDQPTEVEAATPAVETEAEVGTGSVDEEALLTSVRDNLEVVKQMDEATPDELANDSQNFESQSEEPVAAEQPITQANPEFATEVINHLTNPVQGDNLVISSPSLLAYSNYAEDLLISTGVKAPVAILTLEDLQANPEIDSTITGSALLDHMAAGESRGAIAKVGGRYLIAIGAAENEAQKLELVMHEAVGHVIAYTQYEAAPAEQRSAIEADYHSYVERVKSRESAGTLIKDMYPFNFAKEGKVNLPVSESYVSVLQEGTNVGKEWLANQITKWATTDAKPLTLADKWFRKLAVKLRAALGRLKRKGDTSALAVPSVSEWLNSIFDPSRLDTIQIPNVNSVEVVEVKPSKPLSRAKKVAALKKLAKPEDLKRFKLQEEKDGDHTVFTLVTKVADGQRMVLKAFKSESRMQAYREAEYYKLVYAVAGVNLLEKRSNTSKRIQYYQDLLGQFKETLQTAAEHNGISFQQQWLEFLANPMTFQHSETGTRLLASLDARIKRIWNRIEKLATNDPNALRKLIVYEKRVIPVETQEVAKTEEVINKELEATEPAVKEEVKKAKRVIVRKKGEKAVTPVVPVTDSNQNPNENLAEPGSVEDLKAVVAQEPVAVQQTGSLEQRVIEAAQKAAANSIIAGDKPNVNRIISAVSNQLQLSGKDLKEAQKVIKDNWSDLSTGKEIQLSQPEAEGVSIPDDVSDEEAAAYFESIDNFARRKKTPEEVKAQKIKDTLFVEPKKTRKRKELTPEEIAEKEAAKLERRSKAERQRRELLQKVVQLAEFAKSKDLSLTEYLSQQGFSDEDNVKMMRLYLQHQGSIFSQREQIIRISKELGLYDSETGDSGLNELIKIRFPKSYGTLDTLGIRGRDVMLHLLQKMHEEQTGEAFDFTKEQTLRDFKHAKRREFDNLSGFEKARIAMKRVVDRVQDVLSTTPAGSKIVYQLKQIQSAQYSLYSRDYMRKIDEMLKEIPDKEQREKLTEKYLNDESASNPLEEKYLGLMHQLFSHYGMEMERLGFKIYYNSKRQDLFKYDPSDRYFPRIWPDGFFEKPSEEAIQSLIRSGEAINEEDARKIINRFRRRYNRLHVPRYANMELARETNLDGWIKDPVEVMRRYVASGSRRLAVVRIMGPQAEAKLVSLAAEHLRQSNIPEAMEDAINAIQAVIGGKVGNGTDTAASWGVNETQAYAVITMLQHSVFLQPGVAANVSAVTGYKNLLKGFSKIMFTDKATREVNKARAFALGVSEQFIAREMYDNLDEKNPVRDRADKMLRSWGMIGLDQWMRAGSALAAEGYIQEEIAKAVSGSENAKKNLRELYIDPEAVVKSVNDGNEEDVADWIRMGAYRLTNQTNFATDALTTPKILEKNHPLLQMLTLFSRFSYHQHKYFSDMIRNNPQRLLKQIPSQLMIGAPIYMLRLLAKGIDPFKQLEEDGVFATLWKMFMSGSGLGLFAEAAISAMTGMGGRGGGPVAGKVSSGLQSVGSAVNSVRKDEPISDATYVKAIRGLVDAGIYVAARYTPAKIGIPVAAGLGFAAPAIEKNFVPTKTDEKTNWTGR